LYGFWQYNILLDFIKVKKLNFFSSITTKGKLIFYVILENHVKRLTVISIIISKIASFIAAIIVLIGNDYCTISSPSGIVFFNTFFHIFQTKLLYINPSDKALDHASNNLIDLGNVDEIFQK
jgi:hypothetical protein